MRTPLPQRCPVSVVYVTWAAYLFGAVFLAATGRLIQLVSWLVVLPGALWLYVRIFPRISVALGYGSVVDRQAGEVAAGGATRVTLYTGLGCPFCPIVESRLKALQPELGFELAVVDVTVRPDIAAREHIRALPMVEVEGRRRAGCATTDELASFIGGRAMAAVPVGAGI